MLAVVFKSLYMESERVNTLHKRPKTSTDTLSAFASLFRVPEGFSPKTTLAKWIGKHLLGGDVPNLVRFFGCLLPPSVAPHCSRILWEPRDERGRQMKIPYRKHSGQIINQQRLRIYNLRRRRVYQISWNIYGQHLVIPGSRGTCGKVRDYGNYGNYGKRPIVPQSLNASHCDALMVWKREVIRFFFPCDRPALLPPEF